MYLGHSVGERVIAEEQHASQEQIRDPAQDREPVRTEDDGNGDAEREAKHHEAAIVDQQGSEAAPLFGRADHAGPARHQHRAAGGPVRVPVFAAIL